MERIVALSTQRIRTKRRRCPGWLIGRCKRRCIRKGVAIAWTTADCCRLCAALVPAEKFVCAEFCKIFRGYLQSFVCRFANSTGDPVFRTVTKSAHACSARVFLTDTAISPLEREFVQLPDAFCNDVCASVLCALVFFASELVIAGRPLSVRVLRVLR